MLGHRASRGLPTIVEVGAFEEDGFCITLSNRHSIWLELSEREAEPQFQKLIVRGEFHSPKTDGLRLYWEDGPSLYVKDIFRLVMRDE